ncbi:MAG: uncharacterized protein H6Q18_237 [Bacteroidetes bacterium]|nr:uncharacterized protein [Bacteroidota bacterium]
MAKDKGILLTENMELDIKVVRDAEWKIVSGFQIGDVTRQNQQTIILAQKGEIKEAPTLGVGLASFVDDDDPSDLLREIRVNLREDGQVVNLCGFNSSGKLVVDANYES